MSKELSDEQMFDDLMVEFDEKGFYINLCSNPEEDIKGWKMQLIDCFNRLKEENAELKAENEKLQQETAREILKEFEYCNDKTFFTKWYDLCKQFGVDLGE